LEIAALDDGAIVEVAAVNVVDGVAENVVLFGGVVDRFVYLREGGGGDDQEGALEVIGGEEFFNPNEFTGAVAILEFGGEGGGHYCDACAGLQEAGNFGSGDGATTDDEDRAVVEF